MHRRHTAADDAHCETAANNNDHDGVNKTDNDDDETTNAGADASPDAAAIACPDASPYAKVTLFEIQSLSSVGDIWSLVQLPRPLRNQRQ